MCKQKGFTLIELLVVISIIGLLMSILMPALQRVRKQARAVACQGHLRQWGPIFSMYLEDNEGKFSEFSPDVEHIWIAVLRPYYQDPDVCLCPTTTKTWMDGVIGTFVAWDWRAAQGLLQDEFYEYYAGAYGSYGKNSWLSQAGTGAFSDRGPSCWRNIKDIKNPSQVPLLLDCNFLGGFPEHTDSPPEYDGYFDVGYDEISRYCINRHEGYINGLFADYSVRKVGLKQLWRLKWHRDFDTRFMYGPWPEWMDHMRDY